MPTHDRKDGQRGGCPEDGDLEMAHRQREKSMSLNDIPDLPQSVAYSLLYSLPREIRDRIYALCLTTVDDAPIEWPRLRENAEVLGLQPQLLRTCRIIHDEAAPLLYTLNTITFHHPSDANMFVHAFASSPAYGRQITNLTLHVKAQDMRLWMPYMTSADEHRSLKADFPNLKSLGVRFRSSKWQHTHTPDANLRTWSDDSRLEEMMDGLRHVFFPSNASDTGQISEREFTAYMARNPIALQQDGDTIQFRRRLVELQKSKSSHSTPKADAPVIRVCCACRVHSTHFNALTTPMVFPASVNGDLPPQAPAPVREGEPFRGFTAIDLQTGVKRLHDPDLGSANVARTAYAEKNGILLALEVHCLDPKGADRTV